MPRLSSSLLRRAASRSAHLPRLLRECRDLDSATNELRWLTEYAHESKFDNTNTSPNARLMQYVQRRSTGEPLQYILGNQPFGDLDILCRKNVLIPRLETETYATTLAELLHSLRAEHVVRHAQPINIADLCTGTGCIALLLHSLLVPADSRAEPAQDLVLLAVDVSPHALQLARENLTHNLNAGLLHVSCTKDVSFASLDVLQLGKEAKSSSSSTDATWSATHGNPVARRMLETEWDVIVSNPPYISSLDYAPGGTVGRSVRDHEPKLALVPFPAPDAKREEVDQADQFYVALLHIARTVRAKLLVMEIGDAQQASRVRSLTSRIMPDAILVETWRDDGSVDRASPSDQSDDLCIKPDQSHERAVVVWTGTWAEWRRNKTGCR